MNLRGSCNGAKCSTEAMGFTLSKAVGEHSVIGRSVIVRTHGRNRRDYVGMSSDKTGEKPVRRKTKDSWARLIRLGLVGA